MQGQTLIIIVLGIVAIATTVQAVALVGALLAVRRLEARFGEAERELRALRPRLEQLGGLIDNVAGWTDSTADRLRGIAELGAMVLVKPLRPLGTVIALWKGLKSGARAYRQFRSPRIPAEPVHAFTQLPEGSSWPAATERAGSAPAPTTAV